jgi:CDP-paratose 2-epimerase
LEITGLDNLSRKGSEHNVSKLQELGVSLLRKDIRNASDIEDLEKFDWIIDCSANPSVLAGINGESSSRQLIEHNLLGTINLLEYCKLHRTGLILLSTSRVYSATKLAQLPVKEGDFAFTLKEGYSTTGISSKGISETFPTSPPISLYGASKLASETIILEYAEAFGFPVWINRCGVLAGAGQFGKADQGIFSFWIHSFREQRQLKYIGFDGSGLQVRDALHPKDLTLLLWKQMNNPNRETPKTLNLGGGIENAMSLRQLTAWCEERFGPNEVLSSSEERPADAPWIVMDSSVARDAWDWKPQTQIEHILNEIAVHAENNPHWLRCTT